MQADGVLPRGDSAEGGPCGAGWPSHVLVRHGGRGPGDSLPSTGPGKQRWVIGADIVVVNLRSAESAFGAPSGETALSR
jgi:hypothetical protein